MWKTESDKVYSNTTRVMRSCWPCVALKVYTALANADRFNFRTNQSGLTGKNHAVNFGERLEG